MNCPDCGSEMKKLYPGNDPENGPRALRCPNGCYHGEVCIYCGGFFHDEPRDTPKRRGTMHNSWGHGLPEVDEEDRKFLEVFPPPPDEDKKS